LIVGIIAWFPYAFYALVGENDKCHLAAVAKCSDNDICMTEELSKCGGAWYLQMEKESGFMRVVKVMCTWLLLFVNLVPISLMISLEVVKYF